MKLLILLFLSISLLMGCVSNDASSKMIKADSTKTGIGPSKAISKWWLGKWERQQWQNDASLEITKIKDDSIVFSIFASSGGHTGEMEGTAIVNDTVAIFSSKDGSDTCVILFKLSGDSIIVVDQKKGFCFAGSGGNV